MSTPKFKASALRADAPHKVTCTLTLRDEMGERQDVSTVVFYRGLSLNDMADFPTVEGLEGAARIEAVKQQLARLVHSIPDFGVGPASDGFEQEPDAAFFGDMDDAHVNAISEAIAADREVPTKPSVS